MPPRISAQSFSTASITPTFRTRPQCLCEVLISTRRFHASPRTLDDEDASTTKKKPSDSRRATRQRKDFFEWLEGPGRVFKNPLPGSTNYLNAYDRSGNLLRQKTEREGATINVIPEEMEEEVQAKEEEEGLDEAERLGRLETRNRLRARKRELEAAQDSLPRERDRDMEPFPLNHQFKSQPVLSESLREEIYRQVIVNEIDISTVSAAFGIDIRRVAAVVRLMTIEKQWIAEGKTLAKPYNKAVLAMLPQTRFDGQKINPHESINDLPVHPHTRKQLFIPTSESRHFTREDAAKAFSSRLLPADARIPHPELITLEREKLEGIDRAERLRRQAQRDTKAAADKEAAEKRQAEWEARHIRVVPSRRWDFKFENVSSENVGKGGRGGSAPGVRYGVPHLDRKKGQVKIPTSML